MKTSKKTTKRNTVTNPEVYFIPKEAIPEYDWGGGMEWAGTGATVGAALGSVIPGVGTVVGGLAGAVLGGLGGYFFDDSETEARNAERMAKKVAQGQATRNTSKNIAQNNNGQSIMYGPSIMKKGGWIQKAVNPSHRGFCSPMTKATCTPHRKALAMTFKKHHGFHKAEGGLVFTPDLEDGGNMVPAELEKQEVVQTPNGQVDQVNLPTHEQADNIEASTGVNPNLGMYPEGSRVFSDRLKIGGKTFAKHAATEEAKIKRYDNLMKKHPDAIRERSINMMRQRSEQKLDALYATQEAQKNASTARKQFALGGNIIGGLTSSISAVTDSYKANQENKAAAQAYYNSVDAMRMNKDNGVLPVNYAMCGGKLRAGGFVDEYHLNPYRQYPNGGPVEGINLLNKLNAYGPYGTGEDMWDAAGMIGRSVANREEMDARRTAGYNAVHQPEQSTEADKERALAGNIMVHGNTQVKRNADGSLSYMPLTAWNRQGVAPIATMPAKNTLPDQLQYGLPPYQSSQSPTTPQTKTPWTTTAGNVLGELGELAPILYNTYRGSQKSQILNPQDYMDLKEIKPIRIDTSEQQRQADRVSSNIINNPNISAAERVAAITNLGMTKAGIRQQADAANAQAYLTAEQLDAQRRGENARTALGVTNMNMQTEAARRSFAGAAAEGISKYTQGHKLMKNQTVRDAQLIQAIGSSLDDYELGADQKWYWKNDPNKTTPYTLEQIYKLIFTN